MRIKTFLAVLLLSLSLTSSAGASSVTWTWHASGHLGKIVSCAGQASHKAASTCQFNIGSIPGNDVLHEIITFTNNSSSQLCYGISTNTSYMSGLSSVCVKPHSSKQHVAKSSVVNFQELSLGVFITSGASNQPIGAIASNTLSDFAISLSELQSSATMGFNAYEPKYFAGFTFTHFTLSDKTLCSDKALRVFAIGGRGTFGNSLPGISIFEKAQGTCASTPEFNTKISSQIVNGHTAQVLSNCAGVAAGKCGATQVKANGGLVTWTIPGSGAMKSTVVSVTSYNLSLATLLSVARSIR